MKPAACLLCGKPSVDEIAPKEGEWVQFADYKAPDECSLDHPDGLEYFCDEHASAARLLSSMTARDALAELKRQFGSFPEYKKTTDSASRLSWWKRLFFRSRRSGM